MNWHPIGDINDIPLLGSRCVKTPNGEIAVFRTDKHEAFAIENRRPHEGGPLSEGIVDGTSVTCPLHNDERIWWGPISALIEAISIIGVHDPVVVSIGDVFAEHRTASATIRNVPEKQLTV